MKCSGVDSTALACVVHVNVFGEVMLWVGTSKHGRYGLVCKSCGVHKQLQC